MIRRCRSFLHGPECMSSALPPSQSSASQVKKETEGPPSLYESESFEMELQASLQVQPNHCKYHVQLNTRNMCKGAIILIGITSISCYTQLLQAYAAW